MKNKIKSLTDHKQAEDELKKSEEKYRYLIERLGEAVYRISLPDGKYEYFNPATKLIFGYTEKDFLNNPKFIEKIMHPDFKEYFKEKWGDLIKGIVPPTYEYKIIDPKGNERWILQSNKGIFNEKGNIIALESICRDVTKQKKADIALRTNERKFFALFENANDAIFLYKIDKNQIPDQFLEVNKIACKLLGYSREELLKMTLLEITNPIQLKNISKLMKMRQNTGKLTSETNALTKDGKKILCEISSQTFQLENENVILSTIRDISERKKTEKKLKESEKQYREMITYLDVGFYSIEIDGTILNYNPKFSEILGFKNSDNLIGLNVSNFWQKPELRKEYLEEIMNLGFVKNYIVHSNKKDSEKIVLQVNSHLLKDDMGTPIKIEGTLIDYTDKFRLEQKLKESEEKYRNILENMQDGYFEVDLKGNWTYVNNYICKYRGCSKDDLIGRNYREILDKANIKEIFKRFNQVYREEIPKGTFEAEIIRNDGKKRSVEGSIYLKYDSKGKKVGFYSFSHDVTERKKAEQKLKKSEEEHRNMLNNLDVGFYKGELKGKLLIHNIAINKILECVPSKNLIGTFAKDFFKDEKQMKLYYDTLMKNGFIKNFIIELKKENGEIMTVSLNSHLVKNKITGEQEVEGTVIDITEKFRLEQKLRESEKRYRDFTSIASHEFKTPLIPIIGMPQLLLNDNNLTEQQKDSLNEILHSGKKLNKLIDNLLDTSQIERTSIELIKKEIEINTLIDSCISDLSFLIKQKNIILIKNLQKDIKLNIDDKKISRVLTNLISNAIKYTISNGKIEISSQIDKENNFIFSIKDNGIGIEEKDKDLIFQKFGKIRREEIVKYKLDFHGSGLGLFISKEIIKLHGGEMWFESAGKNNGTIFYFKLPKKLVK